MRSQYYFESHWKASTKSRDLKNVNKLLKNDQSKYLKKIYKNLKKVPKL